MAWNFSRNLYLFNFHKSMGWKRAINYCSKFSDHSRYFWRDLFSVTAYALSQQNIKAQMTYKSQKVIKPVITSKVDFFFGWPIVILTWRTRQDSDKWFSACETLEKKYAVEIFFWLPRLITWPEISHWNCSKWPKKTIFANYR